MQSKNTRARVEKERLVDWFNWRASAYSVLYVPQKAEIMEHIFFFMKATTLERKRDK